MSYGMVISHIIINSGRLHGRSNSIFRSRISITIKENKRDRCSEFQQYDGTKALCGEQNPKITDILLFLNVLKLIATFKFSRDHHQRSLAYRLV